MTQTEIDQNTILELANSGVIYGHKKSKTHPKMKGFIGAQRNEIEILKPELVIKRLEKATEFLKDKMKAEGTILLVGTHVSAHEAIKKFADAFGFPAVTTRWLGGTLTNWNVMKERIKYYLELKEKKEKGELAKYTKKEQVDFSKELEKLRQKFEGLVNMKKLPDAVVIIDPKIHETAVREANVMKIPIVALMDTNDDPSTVEYPVIGNDRTKTSINWIIEKIITALHHEGTDSKTS